MLFQFFVVFHIICALAGCTGWPRLMSQDSSRQSGLSCYRSSGQETIVMCIHTTQRGSAQVYQCQLSKAQLTPRLEVIVKSDCSSLAHACSGAGHHYAGGGQYKEGSSASASPLTLNIVLKRGGVVVRKEPNPGPTWDAARPGVSRLSELTCVRHWASSHLQP